MQRLVVEGGNKICGEIEVQGAKNSALPLMSAALLVDGVTVFKNCPKLSDVYAAGRILTCLGGSVRTDGDISIDTGGLSKFEVPEELMREMRSSIVFLGAIIGRFGRCRLSFPGGCELGPRPIDMHLAALRKMGVSIKEEHGILDCSVTKELHGASIPLPFPSVGATENIILAAVLAKGETVIKNAAREPEINDLANFLNKCGAKIEGAGESTIRITGVKKLNGCEYRVMPDRIVACTYLSAAAITGGEVTLINAEENHIDAITPFFEQMGCKLYSFENKLYLSAPNRLKSVRTIRTMPYPGFPTDAQAILMAVLTKSDGASVFVENIFENRYKHVDGLLRMGADVKVEGKVAIVEGVEKLYGANVASTDLRGGAALVIAGLAADGVTTVTDIKHIDRGYESIENSLSLLGAKIKRESF